MNFFHKTDVATVEPPPGEVTLILDRIHNGDDSALCLLIDAVYSRVRQIACQITNHSSPITLTASDLVHETYLKLVSSGGFLSLRDRNHLYATFAKTTKDVLVDYARSKRTIKRGGLLNRMEFEFVISYFEKEQSFDIVELAEAIEALATESPRAAKVVDLRFFGGFSIEQTAKSLNVSVATVNIDWRFARAYLANILSPAA